MIGEVEPGHPLDGLQGELASQLGLPTGQAGLRVVDVEGVIGSESKASAAVMANPSAFSAMMASPKAFEAMAVRPSAIAALAANQKALAALAAQPNLAALMANPSFSAALNKAGASAQAN